MERKNRNFFKKGQDVQFKRRGSNNKGRRGESRFEQSFESAQPLDTVYRILCPSKKIGGVIGKGGSIIKDLRIETQARITIADSVPGSDERVIVIYNAPKKIPQKHNSNEDLTAVNEQEQREPHCAAQDALMRVHTRIIEEDPVGGASFDDDHDSSTVSARLLVPNNLVGCLLGKGGDVIQRLRSETGATIRVLPADHLPRALGTDELVQISGKPDLVERALYEVSTLLHLNPRKDKPPLDTSLPYRSPGFHTGAPVIDLQSREREWSQRNFMHDLPPMQWSGYEHQPSAFGPGGHDGVPPGHLWEQLAEFCMKILCSAGKIGGVIGKGGINVKQLQLETGASIHVEDVKSKADERVIRVSASETLCNRRSQTIDAILQLQTKTGECSEAGVITTRLLVPSSKVGCIIGQGGQVINEMRRRTHADIRVYPKDDRPKCASEDDELVEVSGSFGVAKDALAEIASRLRARILRDANEGAEPVPNEPLHKFGPSVIYKDEGPPRDRIRAIHSVRDDHFKGGWHENEPRSYPVPRTASGFHDFGSSSEFRTPYHSLRPVIRSRGNNHSDTAEVPKPRPKFQDPQSGYSETVYEIHGDHLAAPQNNIQANSGFEQSMRTRQRSYQYMNSQQTSYGILNAQEGMNVQKSPHVLQDPYTHKIPYAQGSNIHKSPYAQQVTFTQQSSHVQQAPYPEQSSYAEQAPYIEQMAYAQQVPYPEQKPYVQQTTYTQPSSFTQQRPYAQQNPYGNAPQEVYHNIPAPQGSYQY